MEYMTVADWASIGMLIGYIGFIEPRGTFLGVALFSTLVWAVN